MSQEQVEATKLMVNRTLEWLSRLLQALLLAALLWFGSEVVELRTVVAVLTARLESTTQLAGVNLQSAIQQINANEKRDDRQDNHIESIDIRVRAIERNSRSDE